MLFKSFVEQGFARIVSMDYLCEYMFIHLLVPPMKEAP